MLIVFQLLHFIIFVYMKDIHLYKNNEQVLDSFSQFGIILGANITYQSATDQPCQIVNQRIVNKKIHDLVLISDFQESKFSQLYRNGQLTEEINQIVTFVEITTGAVVLINNGELIYIKQEQGGLTINSKTSIFVNQLQFSKPTYLMYIKKSEELLIILNQETLKIKLNRNSTNIFGSSTRIYDVFKTDQLKSVALVEDLLFIAAGQFGLYVYIVSQRAFEQISCTIKFANITDLKVFQENSVYYIFSLDYETGIKVITYNTKTTLFYENKQLTNIPYKGEIIDLYKQVLMVVEEREKDSIIHEFKVSYSQNKWELVNQHLVQKNIQDIEITEDYAIIIGSNSHEIIYHSLPQQSKIIQDKIVIPGLQFIHIVNNTYSSLKGLQIIGVTKHTFFAASLTFIPQYLSCYYSESLSYFQFTYNQNSTRCPNEITRNSICEFQQNYTVSFIHPVLTTEESIYIYLVTLFIILIFIFILIGLINEFRKYSFFVHSQAPIEYQHHPSSSAPTQDMFALNSFDSPQKTNKIGSYIPPPIKLQEFKAEPM